MSALPILALFVIAGSPTPATATPTPKSGLAELVNKLGDKSYRARETAARQLLLQGSAAVAALKEGTKHEDPEVRERCQHLLVAGPALERRQKLEALVADPKSPPSKELPGLERFLKITGDSKEARELYAEMAHIHMHVLEAANNNPKEAGKFYSDFCMEAYARFYGTGQMTRRYSYDNLFMSRGEITFFIFLSSDTRVKPDPQAPNYSSVLLNGNQIVNAIDLKQGTMSMRKLFLDWLENESQPYVQQQIFQLAGRAELKEALPIALKLLDKKGNNDQYSKAQVMLSLIKLGSKDHLKVLEPYLSEKLQVTSINFGNGKQFHVQLRDVAMGVQILLAGQKMTDFGYDNQFGGANQMYPYYYGFTDDKSRDDAHAKWKEWKGKNLPAASGTAPDAKTPEKKEPEKIEPAKKEPEKKK